MMGYSLRRFSSYHFRELFSYPVWFANKSFWCLPSDVLSVTKTFEFGNNRLWSFVLFISIYTIQSMHSMEWHVPDYLHSIFQKCSQDLLNIFRFGFVISSVMYRLRNSGKMRLSLILLHCKSIIVLSELTTVSFNASCSRSILSSLS